MVIFHSYVSLPEVTIFGDDLLGVPHIIITFGTLEQKQEEEEKGAQEVAKEDWLQIRNNQSTSL